jgi:hypothetical protein
MSRLVQEEFDRATQDVVDLHGSRPCTRLQLVGRYGVGAPDTGPTFLCAEFVLSDFNGSRRTFVYLTAASEKFVKVRITLRTNDVTDPTARNFADALASQLWVQ